ncbi:cysteine proteinase [Epithele typhae]|uniref:cysteine proteinase n=1 Tax=Epithele typhae TaxID=378194 RepID=UPI0020072EEB|nr:cysteine proteinase [Epithele typhae]XP_047883898.1 cysteine proteinase [Epithele typhae]KAH9893901.1 cysteine proteinase [Epithele typhae]KAH9946175.1 cysteine proteinase [Epithele typhae]
MAPKKIKNKIKKALSPPHSTSPPEPTADDDALMDDLMAQLDSKNGTVRQESATVLQEMQINQVAESAEDAAKKDSKARFKARQARKAAALVDSYAPNDTEADARIQRETKEEEASIKQTCEELGLTMFEITPDGHCLFSAVADQLSLLGILPSGQANYAATRMSAASYIHSHPDDFLPFLPSEAGEDAAGATDSGLMTRAQFEGYCTRMRDTAIWGGEPEIQALSRVYNVPIHVVQGGQPPVVVHEPVGSVLPPGDKRVYISYHRRLYGLGEHYNSLRPKTVLNTIKAAFH